MLATYFSQECMYDTLLYIWVICMNILKFLRVLHCSSNGIASYNSATMIQWLRCKNLCKKIRSCFAVSQGDKISNDMLANKLLRRNIFKYQCINSKVHSRFRNENIPKDPLLDTFETAMSTMHLNQQLIILWLSCFYKSAILSCHVKNFRWRWFVRIRRWKWCHRM